MSLVAAQLKSPNAISIDSLGNIYILDGNTRVRRVFAGTTLIDTVLGNVGYMAAPPQPYNLIVTPLNRLYVSSQTFGGIVHYNIPATQAFYGMYGTGKGGAPDVNPIVIGADTNGLVYVTTFNYTYSYDSNSGTVVQLPNLGGNFKPNIYFDYVAGFAYATVWTRIVKISLVGGSITPASSVSTIYDTGSNNIGYMSRDLSGNYYFPNATNANQIMKLTPASNYGTSPTVLLNANNIAGSVDASGNTTFIDASAAQFCTSYFNGIYGTVVDGSNNLYFLDKGLRRVRKITAVNGVLDNTCLVSTVAGTGISGYNGDSYANPVPGLPTPDDGSCTATPSANLAILGWSSAPAGTTSLVVTATNLTVGGDTYHPCATIPITSTGSGTFTVSSYTNGSPSLFSSGSSYKFIFTFYDINGSTLVIKYSGTASFQYTPTTSSCSMGFGGGPVTFINFTSPTGTVKYILTVTNYTGGGAITFSGNTTGGTNDQYVFSSSKVAISLTTLAYQVRGSNGIWSSLQDAQMYFYDTNNYLIGIASQHMSQQAIG